MQGGLAKTAAHVLLYKHDVERGKDWGDLQNVQKYSSNYIDPGSRIFKHKTICRAA